MNGVELHYVARGEGAPVVFVHGGLADYREWARTIEPLTPHYRTIAYSRRYNYPNQNAPIRPSHSAVVEAEDLAGLIQQLKLGPTHIVGFSYGGYTALLLALKHPELVRTLVLVEPPVLRWLPDLAGGTAVFHDFMSRMWVPAGEAFRRGDREQALRVTADYFVGVKGAYDQLPVEFRTMLNDNIREWEALTTSTDAFPSVTREDVRRIKVPVLILSGENSYQVGKIIDPELARLLENEERVIIPNATHEMCTEHPEACAQAIRAFLAKD